MIETTTCEACDGKGVVSQNTIRKSWSHWPWSMLPVSVKRRVGHGLIMLRGPMRFMPLQSQLSATRARRIRNNVR